MIDYQLLATVPLFEGMSDEELQSCAELFEPTRFLMGDTLTAKDDFGYSLFLVLSGTVRVDREDRETIELGAGEHFGEVSLVTGNRRNATVKAAETCQLAKMMVWNFEELTDRNPVLAGRIKAVAEERL